MKTLEQYFSMIEALRPLVGENRWDYCIAWKLSQDQRFLEWLGCCCSGTEASTESGGGLFSMQRTTCRDLKFEHLRTRACDALSEFPSSIPLASSSEIYAQVLMSNQPTWETNHLVSSTSSYETLGAQTRALVPFQGGLVELVVSKHVPEDQQTVDFIMSSFEDNCDYTSNPVFSSQQFVPSADPQNFQWDLSSPLNLFDGSVVGPTPQMDSTFDSSLYQQQSMMASGQGGGGESSMVVEGEQEKDSVKQEGGRGDSGSEGSEEEEDTRPVGRNGKRGHSKNLIAERKRRKKLNDRLYALRSLVPKITKMDRASILGDAIEYVIELQKRVKDLQDELEGDTINPYDDEANKQNGNNMEAITQSRTMTMMMSNSTLGMELDESPNSLRAMTEPIKQSHEQSNNEDKGPQMEPQVEVKKLEGNDFYLKVFCEHKFGGFTRLMEAVSSLGLEVTNVNITTLGTLALNIFTVQKRDNEMMQVDQVRDSLLELTRGPNGGWAEPVQTNASNGGECDKHYHSHNHNHHLNSHHHLRYLHQQP